MNVRDFKSVRKGALVGFFTLQLDSGLTIKECIVCAKDDKKWFAFPGKPQIDKDGHVMRDPKGKVAYTSIIAVEDRARHSKLQAAVLEALAPHLAESNAA